MTLSWLHGPLRRLLSTQKPAFPHPRRPRKFRGIGDGSELLEPRVLLSACETALPCGVNEEAVEVNAAPVLDSRSPNQTYFEDHTPVRIDANLRISDPDSADFDGGTAVITILNATVGDQIVLQEDTYGGRELLLNNTDILVDGVVVGAIISTVNGLEIGFNANASLAEVRRVMWAVSFFNEFDQPVAGLRSIEFSVSDGDGGMSNSVAKQIDLVPTPDAPFISNTGVAVTFVEGGGPIQIDSTVTVIDPDGTTDWGGTKLNVIIRRNADSRDRLTIENQGNGPGQISVIGNDVFYEGTAIGTFNGGVGTTRLQVLFVGGTTNIAIEAVMRAVRYESLNPNIRVASKDVLFRMQDTDNLDSNVSFHSVVRVDIQTTNATPSLSGIAGTTSNFHAGAEPRTIAPGALLVDNDYNGVGFLTAEITAGGEFGDRLRLFSQGFGTNQVGVINNQIFFENVQIGTWSGGIYLAGNSNPLRLTFNTNATRAAVERVARLVTYVHVNANPSVLQRAIAFTFTDEHGAASNTETAFINVFGN